MNVVYMEYFILKSPVVNYKNMALVKNDHELSVHHVKLLNDCTMKITFIDISVVWLQRDTSYRRTKAYATNEIPKCGELIRTFAFKCEGRCDVCCRDIWNQTFKVKS